MKIKFLHFIRIVVIIISLYPASVSLGQTLPDIGSIDFKTVKVDELSDDQIRKLMQRASENGYSPQQIEAAAISRGMPQEEVQKLRFRMNSIQTVGGTQGTRTISGIKRQDLGSQKRKDLTADDVLNSMFSAEADSLVIQDPRSLIFGYSLFNTRDLTFEPSVNVPTPTNYILGPGDQLNIDIWGVSQQNYQLNISPDGYIVIDKVGPVRISGLSVEEASKKIISRLSSIYSGLRGPNPNTFAQVSLGELRSIKVVLLGEVYLPGSYTISSLSRAFNALYLAGGPNISGSLRNIQIIRDSRIVDSIDVYDFLFKGNIEKNLLLHDQDIIKIDPYSIRVSVNGEVKRPLIYELKKGETVADAIRFSGGFSNQAYTSRIKIYRNSTREKEIVDVADVDFSHIMLQNGDSMIVEKILDRFYNRVEIRGAVYRPGEYSLDDSLTLLKLIEKAEGIKGDAFLSRTVIFRTKENYELEAISVDLNALMNKTIPDITLKREDIVNIPSIFDLQEEYFVQIDGEVKNPGQYPFMYNSTVEDIIIQAGGLLESASMARLEIARRIKDVTATTVSNQVAELLNYQITKDLQISDAGKKLVLQPFDRIFVRRSPGYKSQKTVTIEGEVLFPGEYSISTKNERISDIIKRAGGLTQEAYPKGASILRVYPVDEKERTKTLQSTRLLRNNYLARNNGVFNTGDQTGMNDMNYEVLDSIINSVTQLKNEQAIGINLELILQKPYSKYDLIIEENDRLIIPNLLQTVRLSGGVLHPNNSRYDKRFSFRHYVRSAGGFTRDASRSQSYVIYANGSVRDTRSFMGIKNFPRLEPGAEIIVPQRQRKPVSVAEFATLGTALTSMALVIVTIFK